MDQLTLETGLKVNSKEEASLCFLMVIITRVNGNQEKCMVVEYFIK